MGPVMISIEMAEKIAQRIFEEIKAAAGGGGSSGESFVPKVWWATIPKAKWATYFDLDVGNLVNGGETNVLMEMVSPDCCRMTINTNCFMDNFEDYPSVYPNLKAIVSHFTSEIVANYPGKTIDMMKEIYIKSVGYVREKSSKAFNVYQNDEVVMYSINDIDGVNSANLSWGRQTPSIITADAVTVGGELIVYISLK